MDNKPIIHVKEFIEAFGGRQKVIKKMRHRFAAKLTTKQVDKWVERGSIPGAHLIALQVIGAEARPQIKIMDFIS